MILGLGRMRLALRCAFWLAVCCLFLVSSVNAQEDLSNRQFIDIPAQNAEDAVKTLARANQRSVLFQTDDVVSVKTNAVKGDHSLQHALDKLFEGTKLQGGLTESGAIIVSQRKVENSLGGNEPMQEKRSRFFLTTALSTLAATAAIAQDTTPAGENQDDVIIVVGSQIKGADIAGSLPVSVLGEEEIALTGAVSGDELLASIPQIGQATFNGVGFSGVNGAQGDVSSINLRAIGTGNTLVLLNGRRMVLHPGTQVENLVPVNSVNSNTLPVTGISRVEVLRDGAAALYGTDAVAGVINTVLKDDVEGFIGTVQYGSSEGTSLDELSATIEAGHTFNDGRTNISFFGNFLNRNGMPASELLNSSTEDLRIFFEGTPFEGDTQLRNMSSQAAWGEFRALNGQIAAIGDDDFHIQPDTTSGCLVDLPNGVCADNGGSIGTALRLDRARYRDLIGDTKRGNGFLFINHDLNNNLELYGEASYYRSSFFRRRETAQMLSSNRVVVPSTNFYNVFGDDLQIRDLRPLDVGQRNINVDNDSFRILGGVRGDVGNNWDLDSAFLYSEATTESITNRVSNTLFQQALSLSTPDAYNPFGGGNPADINAVNPGVNSQATIDSFIVDVSRRSKTSILLGDLKLSNADFLQFPAGSVGVAIGVEGRRETFLDDRDDRLDGTITFTDSVTGVTNGSDVMGTSPTPDTEGSRAVYSAFVETAIPVVSPEMDIPFVQSLDVQLAARFESYSDVGEVIKPKVSVSLYPASWLQIRGAYARGFRAPNLEQINATGIRRVNSNREDWIVCEATARSNMTDFSTGDCDGNSVESVRAGGPDLMPENNQNFSLGGVFQPEGSGLTVTVDYWKIKQTDVVGIFGDQNQISLDYLLRVNGSSNPNVIRDTPDAATIALFAGTGLDPAGEILVVQDDYVNLQPRQASGLDFGLYYDFETGIGDFSFSANAAHLLGFFQDPSAAGADILAAIEAGTLDDAVDITGQESLVERNGRPKWRGSAGLTWRNGPFGAGVFGRYIGPVTDTSVTGPGGETFRVDDWMSVNMYVQYTFENAGLASDTRLRFGVRNIADEKPPLADEFATGFYEELHSSRGRYWYGSIRKEF